MSKIVSTPTNPFHIEAVATFGQQIRTCEKLDYMQLARDELTRYLTEYPLQTGYGGAIGLRGGHGSGKTHLLGWLAGQARALRKQAPTVLYAKADAASVFDLYRQLLAGLSRLDLCGLIDQALLALALEHSGRARATEGLAGRLASPNALPQLAEEGNIDLESLRERLRLQLESIKAPSQIAEVLLHVDDPLVGETAYSWLLGDDVDRLEDIKQAHPLRQLGQETTGSSAPDVAAVDAVETLAALHRIAERPLILMIDQLEILLRAEPARQQSLFSVLKKLIEHLSFHRVLLFVAGNHASWDSLPRDVAPRFRSREPLPVGHLTRDETRLLLDAYKEAPDRFSDAAVNSIHRLSGGNPREIIRISYYAFENTGGRLGEVTEEVLLKSADNSGTVADRHLLALQLADPILQGHGSVIADVAAPDGIVIDRLVSIAGVPALALLIVRATDQRSEVDSARRVRVVREYMTRDWPKASLLVVAVGYSSDEVRKLLAATGSVLLFDDHTFAAKLRAEALRLVESAHAAGVPAAEREDGVLEALRELSARLDRLAVQRASESETTGARFAESTAVLAEPARRAREAKTRWEMLEHLDELQEALRHGDISSERRMIRSMLVSNEAHLKDKVFDRLGGIYLDVVSLLPLLRREDAEPLYFAARRSMIAELRRVLRRARFVDRILNAGIARVAVLSAVVATIVLVPYFMWNSYRYTEVFAAFGPGVGGIAVGVASWAVLAVFRFWRFSYWDLLAAKLRGEFEIPLRSQPTGLK